MKARRATVKSFASLKAWMLLCLVMLSVVSAKAQTPYAIWCEGNSTLYFTNSNVTYAVGGTYDGNTITNVWSGDEVTNYGDKPQWNTVVGFYCTKVVFAQSFSEVKLTSMKRWFAGFGLPDLQFVGLENINTSEVTDMSYMFEINRLKNIDLSSLNTGKVTTMKGMFKNSLDLTSIDLSGFNTENVTDMSQMFRDCNALTSLNLSSFNTQKVTDMAQMFLGCGALTDLDLSSFNTENVTSMYYMFARCLKLPSLDLSHFDTGKVTNMTCMFGNCKTLSYLELSNFKTDNVQKMEQMFIDCENLKTIFRDNDWNTENVTNADKMFSGCTSLVGGNGTAYDAEHIDKEYARIDRAGTPGYFTKDRTPYAIWCAGNSTLYFTNSNETYAVDGSFDGQTITNIWSGDELTNYGDQPQWTEVVYRKCTKVVIDQSFSEVKPKSMKRWFKGFSHSDLQFVGLENLNTSEVTDMSYMFNGCSNLTTIDLRNFDTGNVKNMSGMFRDCGSLTSISGLENLNTSNVTNMSILFYGCSSLTVLDLSSFDVSKVEYLTQMFDGCTSLETIYSKNDWNTQYPGTADTAFMFDNCTSLIGGNGTEYSRAYTNGIYANLDVNGKRGYFTSTFEYAISSATVGTLYMDYAVNIPEADYFDAYYVKSINSEGTLYLKKVKDVIPANTGVIIFGNEGTYKMVQISKEVPAINDNLLCGVTKATSVASLKAQHGKDIYVLSRGKDSYINFLKAGSGVKNIPANRAYLPYSSASGAKELSIVFDEEGSEATGIDNVATEKAERTGVFNLSGQRVANPQHGIYIVNGKRSLFPKIQR